VVLLCIIIIGTNFNGEKNMTDHFIVPAKSALAAFRESGYKDTASALAEIIDNSIEAMENNPNKSRDVKILVIEAMQQTAQKTMKKIDQIAIFDNGCGMSKETLLLSLQFGNGTRLNSRNGMGRFGVGLPQSSISQCKRVEVYSWQKKGEVNYTYLDYDEIQESNRQVPNEITTKNIPKKIIECISQINEEESGSVVVWSKCDRLDIAKGETLFKRMEQNMCRMFRHYLDDDDEYGIKVNIEYSIADTKFNEKLKPNDPLYLMTPNTLPGYNDEATNLFHEDKEIEIPFYDLDGKPRKSTILMKFSIAKPSIQTIGADQTSEIAKHYRKNAGISFVRKAREIDFGTFNFFNPDQQMPNRYWGCEVRFEPELDELFGVTNNKQSVRNIRPYDASEYEESDQEDPKVILLNAISKNFKEMRKQAMKIITARGVGSKSGNSAASSANIANLILEGSRESTKSQLEGSKKSDEIKKEEWRKLIEEDSSEKTMEEIQSEIRDKLNRKVEISFGNWPGNQFFTMEYPGQTAVVKINRDHPFFTEMYDELRTNKQDEKSVSALDLMMMAFARMEDEMFDKIEFDEIRETWGKYVKEFLKQQSRISN
tara:strand:- start:1016 stop:2812 length:1797 start_codon:yes stop_codon:yes gene_type:complete